MEFGKRAMRRVYDLRLGRKIGPDLFVVTLFYVFHTSAGSSQLTRDRNFTRNHNPNQNLGLVQAHGCRL